MSNKPSICFVALNAYNILSGDKNVRHVGGAEVQQVIIARELLKRGYRVTFVTLDHGQDDGEDISGISVYKCYRQEAGRRVIRFFHPRLIGLWAAMKRADADIYYQRGADSETGLVACWCRMKKRPFMFAIAHDTNCDPTLPLLSGRLERRLYVFGLRSADVIIAQTSQQIDLLTRGFGRSAHLVRSSCEMPTPAGESMDPSGQAPKSVLWIGRISSEKRPEWVVGLAEKMSDCTFDVVGQYNVASPYGRAIVEQLTALANVRYHGYVPRAKLPDFYRRADLLLSTSEAEGFPNVFLEAWSYGTGVLSTVDPDGIIEKYGLGRAAPDLESLSIDLSKLEENSAFWKQCGQRAKQYVFDHHRVEATVDKFEIALSKGLHLVR